MKNDKIIDFKPKSEKKKIIKSITFYSSICLVSMGITLGALDLGWNYAIKRQNKKIEKELDEEKRKKEDLKKYNSEFEPNDYPDFYVLGFNEESVKNAYSIYNPTITNAGEQTIIDENGNENSYNRYGIKIDESYFDEIVYTENMDFVNDFYNSHDDVKFISLLGFIDIDDDRYSHIDVYGIKYKEKTLTLK